MDTDRLRAARLRALLGAHFYDWRLSRCFCDWRPPDVDDYVRAHLEHLAQALEGSTALGSKTVGGPR